MQPDQTTPERDAPKQSSVSPDEIARFGRLAADWWNPRGPMRPLHDMNPLRVGWAHARLAPLRNQGPIRLLDLGCGAGLASEAFARLGYDVLGVDASAEAIAAARVHAALEPDALQARGGRLEYRAASAEELVAEGRQFDAITALEVIEHVTDPAAFLALLASLLRPGGIIVLSTLNRTWQSLATAKIGAEYVLRLLPAGTHDWNRFITPAELSGLAARAGLRTMDIAGMVPAGLHEWRESRRLGVNYIVALAV
ncbi:bifunctional 2-polyprenyl-6-hydroxyphenol methylase/3-demethylubiquinol 3-O-methyltransferase UbiG [Lichenicola sp.]|uniref:bifunctional 2-polyprenyl-6-hydroxyphenol methylase/3-demethylubiquinol 3-O-methyltransferase UbiG n=1 Tax=Lichenicola sp. TaxID=2804529 RepID=UPI003B00DB07